MVCATVSAKFQFRHRLVEVDGFAARNRFHAFLESFRNIRFQQMTGMLENLPAVLRWQRFDFVENFGYTHDIICSRRPGKDKPVKSQLRRNRLLVRQHPVRGQLPVGLPLRVEIGRNKNWDRAFGIFGGRTKQSKSSAVIFIANGDSFHIIGIRLCERNGSPSGLRRSLCNRSKRQAAKHSGPSYPPGWSRPSKHSPV